MKKIAAIFSNRWVIGALGILALSLLIWFGGPLLGFGDSRPLESALSRILFIGFFVVLWAVIELVRWFRSRQAAKKIGEGLVEEDESVARSAEEVEALKERFEEAVEVLRKTGSGRGQRGLYELPWYIIIGPPGSGKTTALMNSGLRFPLAEKFGNEALRGVGGTRNCDWWFTDEAILLDTAGRYTTQDSQADVDRAAWEGFLNLLKMHRKRRPINGVLIAISLSDLMLQSDQERFAHARAIKQRVQELDSHFGIRLPVYVVLTKCDLIAGFMEFFEDLGADERAQVWGMTFPLTDETDGDAERKLFPKEFESLLHRLESRLLARLNAEQNEQRRGLIYGFPRQLSSLQQTIQAFITEVFSGSRFDQAPMLRGVYFSSGTQEGTPIDRVMGAMVRAFGIDQRQQPAFTGHGRSYFITRLLRDVVFPESEIAGTNRRVELRRAWLQRGAYASIVLFLAGAVVAWSVSYTRNVGLIAEVVEAGASAAEQVDALPVSDRDPTAVLSALDALRNLPGGYAERDEGGPLTAGFGLYQGKKFGGQAEAAYRRVMLNQLLPRVMFRLEFQVDRDDVPVDYTYEALKAYLMLGSEAHYDAESIEAWVVIDWEEMLYGRLEQERFNNLVAHLLALLEERPVPLPMALDSGRVAAARARLARISLEKRIYIRLKNAGLADNLPGFTVLDAAGSNAGFVFVRASGQPLSVGLPGLFTRAGYDEIFTRSDSLEIVQELLAEQWVLRDNPGEISRTELPDLFGKVRDIYLDEYASAYEDLIFDVKLAPFADADEAARILNIVSGPDSPLLLLIDGVKRQTTFSNLDQKAAEGEEAEADPYQKLRSRLGGKVRTPATVGRASRYANVVEERFASMNAMTEGSAAGSAPVNYLMGLLRQLADFMMNVSRQEGASGIPQHVVESGQKTIQQVRSETARQPNPLISGILESAAEGSANIAFAGLATQIEAQWQSGPYSYCQRAIANRYPMVSTGAEEVRLEDFGEFFGYAGKMDLFFNANIAKYVDTTTRPWTRLRGGDSAVSLSAQAIAMFERANAVKEGFFRGDKKPYVAFELTPISMDANVNRFTLAVDGKTVSYFNGPIISEFLEWPGPAGTGRVRMEMAPAVGTSLRLENGPWAWFRILDGSNLRSANQSERFLVDFSLGGRTARYELVARSAYNPFKLAELHTFQCLSRLTR